MAWGYKGSACRPVSTSFTGVDQPGAFCPRRLAAKEFSVQSNGGLILVTGAGGFIGHHLIKYLKERGHRVRGVDIKEPEFEPTQADEF